MSEMQEMMVDQLRDAISAEKQAIQGMRRMQRKTTDQQLRAGIEAHVAQSELQAERVQQVLEMIGGGKGRKVCQGMRGLVEEAQEELGEHDKGPLLDLVIVAALQRVEHYEIAAYGTMAELAGSLGQNEAAQMLAQILEEEKAQDLRLTELTRELLMQTAMEAAQRAEAEGEQKPKRRAKRATAAAGTGRGRGRPAAKASARGATKASGRGAAKTSGRAAAKSTGRGAAKTSGRGTATSGGRGAAKSSTRKTGTRSGAPRGRRS